MADVDVLVVGAGPAGVAAAETLRAEGFDGSILLAGRELDAPYERPPASKDYLLGTRSKEECLLRPDGFWQEHAIDLRTRTSVMKLDPAARVASSSPSSSDSSAPSSAGWSSPRASGSVMTTSSTSAACSARSSAC